MTADAGEDVEKQENSTLAGGIASKYNYSGNKSDGFSGKSAIVLPEDPAMPFLGTYPEDSPKCTKDICSTMFIAALFITARSWKEPRCPSSKEWIQKIWYTMEYYSDVKNNDLVKFVDKWMDLEDIILSEVTQSQKKSLDMHSLILDISRY